MDNLELKSIERCAEILKGESFEYNGTECVVVSDAEECYRQGYKDAINKACKWIKNSANNKPQLRHSVLMKTTLGIAEGEWQGTQWLQYRWSSKLEDKEVLYWIELYWLDSDLPKEE